MTTLFAVPPIDEATVDILVDCLRRGIDHMRQDIARFDRNACLGPDGELARMRQAVAGAEAFRATLNRLEPAVIRHDGTVHTPRPARIADVYGEDPTAPENIQFWDAVLRTGRDRISHLNKKAERR